MNSEKFTDYAEDKLKVMQLLELSEWKQIELLADGIKEPAWRRFILDNRTATIPEFIESVRRITEDGVPFRRQEDYKQRNGGRKINQASA